MKKKVSFGFSKLTTNYKKLIIPCGTLISVIVLIIIIDKRRNQRTDPVQTGKGSGYDLNKLVTLKNWTTSYNGVDVSKTVVNVFKIRQLFDSTFVIISTKALGTFYTISPDLSKAKLVTTTDTFADINQYLMNNTPTYLASGTNLGGYLYTDLSKFATLNTKGGNMVQLIYSQYNNDNNTFACITTDGTLYVSAGNIATTEFTAIDGPGIGNRKYTYVKMIELNDGSVLLSTSDAKLIMVPNLQNVNYQLVKEIQAPPHFNVTDFTQLNDGTVVAVCNYNNVFIKSMSNLTSNSNWIQINSVNNLPNKIIVKQLLQLQDGTIMVVCDDGNLYFLSE